MPEVLEALVPLVALLGMVVAGAVLLVSRRLRVAVPVLLDFLLAVGLLRLSATMSWKGIASAGVIVVVRKLVVLGIGAARAAEA